MHNVENLKCNLVSHFQKICINDAETCKLFSSMALEYVAQELSSLMKLHSRQKIFLINVYKSFANAIQILLLNTKQKIYLRKSEIS